MINNSRSRFDYRQKYYLTFALVVSLILLGSLPLCFSLVRNYEWERSQPPTAIVPDLIGLDLDTAAHRAGSSQLNTAVLGTTWYTDFAAGRISLQAPEPGQRVPLGTTIGLEVSTSPPAALTGTK